MHFERSFALGKRTDDQCSQVLVLVVIVHLHPAVKELKETLSTGPNIQKTRAKVRAFLAFLPVHFDQPESAFLTPQDHPEDRA